MGGKYEKPREPFPWRNVFPLLLMLIGLAVMFFPDFATREDKEHIENRVEAFRELIASSQTEPPAISAETTVPIEDGVIRNNPNLSVYPTLYTDMISHNIALLTTQRDKLKVSDDFEDTVIDLADYGITDGVVGVVSIPTIEVEMPLYLGGSYENLAKGFAQLSHTSMPTGGIGSNCVIACHRGWRGMAYLRDVEQVLLGDKVYVQTLWEKLTYSVTEVLLINPYELDSIYLVPGRDLLTVVTCHPYGVGSHRYVLVCDRIENESEDADTVTAPTPPAATEPQAQQPNMEWADRVNITTEDGTEFRSSGISVFINKYAKWIALVVVSFIFAAYVISIVRKKIRKK